MLRDDVADRLMQVRRKVATGGGTRDAIPAINSSAIGPGPLGIADTSPRASAPAATASSASARLAMQQILMRGSSVGFIGRWSQRVGA